MSIVATVGLCVALVPLGIQVLSTGPRPSQRSVLGWSMLVVGLIVGSFLIGRVA